MEITGKVIAKPSTLNGANWKKSFIVVRYEDGQYPKDLMLSSMKKADDLERLRVGDKGTFKFDGKVRETNGKYFCDLDCWSWKIEDDMPI